MDALIGLGEKGLFLLVSWLMAGGQELRGIVAVRQVARWSKYNAWEGIRALKGAGLVREVGSERFVLVWSEVEKIFSLVVNVLSKKESDSLNTSLTEVKNFFTENPGVSRAVYEQVYQWMLRVGVWPDRAVKAAERVALDEWRAGNGGTGYFITRREVLGWVVQLMRMVEEEKVALFLASNVIGQRKPMEKYLPPVAEYSDGVLERVLAGWFTWTCESCGQMDCLGTCEGLVFEEPEPEPEIEWDGQGQHPGDLLAYVKSQAIAFGGRRWIEAVWVVSYVEGVLVLGGLGELAEAAWVRKQLRGWFNVGAEGYPRELVFAGACVEVV